MKSLIYWKAAKKLSNCGVGDMRSDLSAQELYSELRLLVVADPKAARITLEALLDEKDERLPDVLTAMDAPGEGRLRQLVANTIRSRGDKGIVLPYLIEWRCYESDEFARLAIDAALNEVEYGTSATTAAEQKLSGPDQLASKQAIDVYRWVATRLCHQVRNSLAATVDVVLKLDHVAQQMSDGAHGRDLATEIALLKDALRQVSRIVEFDISDPYFAWREIHLWAWLKEMAARYSSKYVPVELHIVGVGSTIDAKVTGSDLLLEIVFWNLLKNASQSVTGPCRIELLVSVDGNRVILTMLDNGPGFSPDQSQDAFNSPISSKGPEFGRGLLEVAEAMGRLRGVARLVKVQGGSLRVQLTFPIIIT